MDCIKQTTHLTGLYPLPLLENLEKRSQTNQPNKEEIERISNCWPNADDLDNLELHLHLNIFNSI